MARLKQLDHRHKRAVEMKLQGMKQAEIARALGVHETSVSRWFTAEPLVMDLYAERSAAIEAEDEHDTAAWKEKEALAWRTLAEQARERLGRIIRDGGSKDADAIAASRLILAEANGHVAAMEGADELVEIKNVLTLIKGD